MRGALRFSIAVVSLLCAFGIWVARASAQAPPSALIVNVAVVNRTESTNPDLVSRYFDQPSTFETTTPGGSYSPYASNAIGTLSFADENALESAISSGSLPAGTGAVLYDDEKWSLTPVDQQLNPAYYYQRAANAAHAAGLYFIAAPGTDLVYVMAPGTPPSRQYSEFITLGIPAAAGRYADIYDAQAQGLEGDPNGYANFVQQASYQALAANPGTKVLAGLSTNPNGVEEPASVLLAAAATSNSSVSGWWINDPGPGPRCPFCSGPYPQTVVQFLQGLSLSEAQQSTTITAGATTPTPSITNVSQSHRRWREGGKLASFAAGHKPPIGTTFRFTLNENATVRFAFAQLLPGRRVNGKCVAQTAANRNRRACKRPAPRGSLSFSAPEGGHKLAFRGRLSRARQLKPGTYVVTITATNAVGQRTSRKLTFTIVPG